MKIRSCLGKFAGIVSVLFGVIVLITSGWSLAKTFDYEELAESVGSDESEFQMDSIYNLTYSNPLGIHDNFTITGRIEDDLEANTGIWKWTSKYKTIVQSSIGGTICTAFVQLICSMVLICSSPKKLYRRIRLWQLVHLLITFFLLLCILVPLSYNRDKDSFRGTITFGKYTKSELTKLYEDFVSGKQTIVSYMMNGLNSFYVVIILDIVLITVLILVSCCIFTCRRRSNRTIYEQYY